MAQTSPVNSTTAPGDPIATLERAQEELAGLYREVERLNRLAALGTVAGMIAHEFNNILTPVLSYAQMAAANPEDRALVRKALARTISGSERAARIADAILSFAREAQATSSEAAFHVEQHAAVPRCGVLKAVNEAMACLARDPARDGVALRLRVPATLEVPMPATSLQQVLVNLILNARNALRGGGELEIAASIWNEEPATPEGAVDSRDVQGHPIGTSEPTEGPWACIVVRDTGQGMSTEQLARMFRPFQTGASGDRKGNGLGMVITKRLVEAAGGWLTIESRLGHGTSVTLVLPTRRESAETEHKPIS